MKYKECLFLAIKFTEKQLASGYHISQGNYMISVVSQKNHVSDVFKKIVLCLIYYL